MTRRIFASLFAALFGFRKKLPKKDAWYTIERIDWATRTVTLSNRQEVKCVKMPPEAPKHPPWNQFKYDFVIEPEGCATCKEGDKCD